MQDIPRHERHNPWGQPDPFEDMRMQTSVPRTSPAPVGNSPTSATLNPREFLTEMKNRMGGADNVTGIRELDNGAV